MLIYHRTSILTSTAQTLVNTVNTRGAMGKGLAHAFRLRHPDMFEQYKRICDDGLLDIGKLWLWKGGPQWILNFPTKKHWRYPSKIEYIKLGLAKFSSEFESRGIREIAFPRLGCGNGGLDWDEVRPIMEDALHKLPIVVYIHDYDENSNAPEHVSTSTSERGATFHSFVCDIREIVVRHGGFFRTLNSGKNYRADVGEENSVLISTDRAKHSINEFDLFELWLLLQKGPVGVNRMVGSAKNSGYYLLPILGRLPYTRLINTSGESGSGSAAIEIVKRPSEVLRVA